MGFWESLITKTSGEEEEKKKKEKKKEEQEKEEEQKVRMRPKEAEKLGLISSEEAERLEAEGYAVDVPEKIAHPPSPTTPPKLTLSDFQKARQHGEEISKALSDKDVFEIQQGTRKIEGVLELTPKFVESEKVGSVVYEQTEEGLLQGKTQKGYYTYDLKVREKTSEEKLMEKMQKDLEMTKEERENFEKSVFDPVSKAIEQKEAKTVDDVFVKSVARGVVGTLQTVELATKPEFWKYAPKAIPYLPFIAVEYGKGMLQYATERPVEFAGETVGSALVFHGIGKAAGFTFERISPPEQLSVETKITQRTVFDRLKGAQYDYVSTLKNQKITGKLTVLEEPTFIDFVKTKFGLPESEKVNTVGILHDAKLVQENTKMGIKTYKTEKLPTKIFISQEIGETKYFKEIGTISKGELEFSSVSYVTKPEFSRLMVKQATGEGIRIRFEKTDVPGETVIKPKGEIEIKISKDLPQQQKLEVLKHEVTHVAKPEVSESSLGKIKLEGIEKIDLTGTKKLEIYKVYDFYSRPKTVGRAELLETGEIRNILRKEIQVSSLTIKHYGGKIDVIPETRVLEHSIVIPSVLSHFEIAQPKVNFVMALPKSQPEFKTSQATIVNQKLIAPQKQDLKLDFVQTQKNEVLPTQSFKIAQAQIQTTKMQAKVKTTAEIPKLSLALPKIDFKIPGKATYVPSALPKVQAQTRMKISIPKTYSKTKFYTPSLFALHFNLSIPKFKIEKTTLTIFRPKVKI